MLRHNRPSAVVAFTVLVLLVSAATAPMAASATPPPTQCVVNFRGDVLHAPAGGGARSQEIVVNADCSVTKGPVKTLLPGSPEFAAFIALRQGHANGRVDPTCWSELDYQDVAWANLTQSRLGMSYDYNYNAGQVTAVYPLAWSTMAAADGWYLAGQSTNPYTGPLPWGEISASGTASFAWLAGSFWHQGTNHDSANGFGQCWGYPDELGSTVPGGRWFFTVWQL